MNRKIGITGGASAGHVVPALAVAAELRRAECELVYFGRAGSIEADLAAKAGIRLAAVPSAGLQRFRSWSNLAMPLTVARGIFAAWRAMRRERPDVVFSKGSYVSVPVGIAAWLTRIPLAIHESDHTLGLANRILARVATTVFLAEDTPGLPRWLSRKTVVTGLPLRDDLADGRPEDFRARLGIPTGPPVLLVFCGSSGSQRVNEAVRRQLGGLTRHFSVVHICGRGNLDPALASTPGYWQQEYLHDDMVDALTLADLVIGRAGATTLAELHALAKPAVLVPLPASVSRGDQLDNAKAYAQHATCLVVADEEMADGTPLLHACEQLLPALGGARRRPDPEAVRRTAREIAARTIALTRPRGRHAS
ncbi:UDP-N-acetylglucosamine--N-acetylmuramyl-(pentapeptide) pyrophosphoryl-undecaprenol N-acetylglucosamine transferase [Kitasatospora sp. YST-16]|uniref:UDP-N-acetylglucosamine--N-acetylmuramyl- (pentapeptide) pyrophosphoryl-undecaprenol N-acetylglucosamine transferase n=1 Tax=Kitasatospora sp. YST-16 TaxID=2998080 RepID=UPI0022848D14|nr:UDP-N-acetylglucosamine--N-acetylmuramyl-(pentapeptide) pyrophosphoryl-undecaprenol N-acetylglucosamine transferase [Kitasatospora sp. YST-16]WAL74550.1 UDP-N-acetylglucosamine--N-acetylmuramyl-(pentapeptide) pyrophosphoryl-undecaprenol N-acetylglucosamine transferase [Kitasatospora sp. YST-16]WNW40608.1 UDP-N-acetylglucosamine--N-acetylmuramyl-(pentapeptide) pyrophosphoryl-undecaprenol N-acetylglucosamine transferase [Streptomyces sp. Li-HN-5-13]